MKTTIPTISNTTLLHLHRQPNVTCLKVTAWTSVWFTEERRSVGFEPTVPVTRHSRFRGDRLRPLGQLSMSHLYSASPSRYCIPDHLVSVRDGSLIPERHVGAAPTTSWLEAKRSSAELMTHVYLSSAQRESDSRLQHGKLEFYH